MATCIYRTSTYQNIPLAKLCHAMEWSQRNRLFTRVIKYHGNEIPGRSFYFSKKFFLRNKFILELLKYLKLQNEIKA